MQRGITWGGDVQPASRPLVLAHGGGFAYLGRVGSWGIAWCGRGEGSRGLDDSKNGDVGATLGPSYLQTMGGLT